MEFRQRHQDEPLYVAEIDLRGFYDCVDHELVWQCLQDLAAEARRRDPKFELSERVWTILRGYLDCYCFGDQVKGGAEVALQGRNPKARFAWAEEELEKFHGDLGNRRIGVAQGGAVSNFLANAVLHRVDQSVTRLNAGPEVLTYLRYCDDFIMVSTSREVCAAAMDACLAALKDLKLPVHEPAPAGDYGPRHWDNKSKGVYRWCWPQQTGDVPWVQFLGYHVRYDGAVRVAPKSIKKQSDRLRAEADEALGRIRRGLSQKSTDDSPVRFDGMTAAQLLDGFRRRMIGLSVGWGKTPWSQPRTALCWARGFRALIGRKVIANSLRSLDRYRERQIRRVKRALIGHGLVDNDARKGRPFWGFLTSYVAQFRR